MSAKTSILKLDSVNNQHTKVLPFLHNPKTPFYFNSFYSFKIDKMILFATGKMGGSLANA